MKNILIALGIIILVALGWFAYSQYAEAPTTTPQDQGAAVGDAADDADQDDSDGQTGTSTIGTSVEGRAITAHHFGSGDTELLFVGGIHGGYEWNTVLVARQLIDHLEQNPDVIPENVRVTVIPVLNPDGLATVVGSATDFSAANVPTQPGATVPGRFNANNVDLNRNFDCEWQETGVWQKTEVSGGDAPFSEPEAAALRDYVAQHEPDAAVIWYSAAGGVFAANCGAGVSSETRTLMNTYASSSGYPAHESYDFYAITGDAANWLAKEGVPTISVLLTNHTDVEWNKNRAGIEATLQHYAN